MHAVSIHITVDMAAIEAGLSQEKPPVPVAEWDAAGYLEHRMAAYRDALARSYSTILTEIAGSWTCTGGDRLVVRAATDTPPPELVEAIYRAIRPVMNDTNAWRLFLRPAYFERYKAWRRSVGSPIAH